MFGHNLFDCWFAEIVIKTVGLIVLRFLLLRYIIICWQFPPIWLRLMKIKPRALFWGRIKLCNEDISFLLHVLDFGLRLVPNTFLVDVHFVEILNWSDVDFKPAVIVLFRFKRCLQPKTRIKVSCCFICLWLQVGFCRECLLTFLSCSLLQHTLSHVEALLSPSILSLFKLNFALTSLSGDYTSRFCLKTEFVKIGRTCSCFSSCAHRIVLESNYRHNRFPFFLFDAILAS